MPMKAKKVIAILIAIIFLLNVIMPTALAVETEIINQNNINKETETTQEPETTKQPVEQTTEEQNNTIEKATQDIVSSENEQQPSTHTTEVNDDVEIEFASDTLKNFLLNHYDYNSDGKITQSDMEQIQELTLECFEDGESINLQGLEYAKNLKKLKISEEIQEIQSDSNKLVFQNITKLEELDIKLPGGMKTSSIGYDYTPVGDVLNNLTSLKILRLYNADVTEIDFNIFKNLEELTLQNSKINNIEQLAPLTGLKYFDYSDVFYHFNLSELDILSSQFPNLEYLKLLGEYISDIQFVSKLTKLKTLNLSMNNIEDISPIETLSELEILDLSMNDITNVGPIAKLQKLKELEIFGNKITDITPLENIIKAGVKVNVRSQNGSMETETLQAGDTKEIEMPQIISSAFEPNSVFYSQNYTLEIEVDDDSILEATTNEDKTKLILNAKNKVGTTNVRLKLNSTSSEYCASSEIQLFVKVAEPGDNKEEINISDNALKSYLLGNCDYDDDGKITEYDMLQITSMKEQFGVYISSNEGLQVLGLAKNLKSIIINIGNGSGNPNQFDWSPLAKLENLEQITLRGEYESPEFVKQLTNLKELTLTESGIKDISPLASLTNLEQLDVSSNKIQDFSCLQNFNETIQNNIIANNQTIEITVEGDKVIGEQFVVDLPPLCNQLDAPGNILGEQDEYSNVTINGMQATIEPLKINDSEEQTAIVKINGGKLSGTTITYKYKAVSTDGDPAKIIEIKDTNFKNLLLQSHDLNQDKEISEYEIKQIKTLSIYSNYPNYIQSIEELKYATNLTDLYISGSDYNNKLSISPISELNKLTKLVVTGDIKDIEAISKLENLEELTITPNNTNFDCAIISNLTNLKKLTMSQQIINFDIICEKLNLTELNLNSVRSKINYDKLKYLNDTLKNLSIPLNINDINILNKITELTNLETLKMSLNNNYYINKENAKKEEELLKALENINCENIQIAGAFYVYAGAIECGTTKEIKISDMSPLINAITTEGNKLYAENFKLLNNNPDENLTINEETGTITIKASEFGEQSQYMNASYYYGDSYSYANITMNWNNIIVADNKNEINIPDTNLKDALLRGYDIDEDGKITENDLTNIESLYLSNCNIQDLTGLENAKNLKTIILDNNKISDLTPIKEILSKDIQMVSLTDNYIESLNGLDGIKYTSIDLSNNYIDFSENSTNLKIVQDTVREQAQKEYKENPEMAEGVTEEEYIETEIERVIGYYMIQNYGTPQEREDALEFEEPLKNKLIEVGVDANNDGTITKGELSDFKLETYTSLLDLSSLQITNVENLKYLNNIAYIDLSNNNIEDISPLQGCKRLRSINLNNNKIKDISVVKGFHNVYELNLSNNQIEDISSLGNMREANVVYGYDGYFAGGKEAYRMLDIDLSNNKIRDISVINRLVTLKNLNLSGNNINDISMLSDYDFDEILKQCGDSWEGFESEPVTINLSNNYIDIQNNKTIKAKEHFEDNKSTLILNDQKQEEVPEPEKTPGVQYMGHIQDYGWEEYWKLNGETSGLVGKNKKVEAFYIELTNVDQGAHIQYRTHVQDKGWEENWAQDGAQTGTTSKNKKIEAIQIKLENLPGYSVEYRSYINGKGWQDWVSDGIISGTTGQNKKLEAVQIRIVRTENKVPVMPGVSYRGHVQDIGWQGYVTSGVTSGLVDKNKKVEAFNIRLTNVDENAHIKYQTHIQDIGWEDNWVQDGAQTGTTGKNKKIEAIKIELEGLPGYSVDYRAYVAGQGWQSWVRDGDEAGTTGQNLKLEAIQIKIVKTDPSQNEPGVTYSSHVQDIGWMDYVEDGTTSGIEGQNKKVEAFYIQLTNADPNAHIQYRTHVQDKGWEENWAQDGAITGTTGKNKKVEAIQIKLEGLEGYSVEYRSYVAGQGWQDWVSDGIISGTTGQNLKLEAIQIRIVKTENKIPVMPGVSYRGHVQDIGWQEYVTNGLTSGVEGKGLKVEAFNIRLTNVDENAHIQYQTHIQDKGWEENWIQDGAQTGTTGQNKKVEAIRIKLENLPGYSVQYRAYVAGKGWQDWVKDGEDAGTTGQNLKLEAIQIKIVKQQ